MLYSIKSGTNHYETLGLGPEASFEEIERAYRREMSPLHPRAFGSLGSVTVAYETLRDPIKRRDYDASIGIVRAEPVRVQRRDFHFAGSAHFTGAGLPFPEAAPAAPPAPVEPKPFMAAPPAPAEAPRAEAPKPRPDPATAPMIEDLLREYQARDVKKPFNRS